MITLCGPETAPKSLPDDSLETLAEWLGVTIEGRHTALGDAQAAAIYAQAFNKDSEFYTFVRSLNAYRSTFRSRSDVLLVDPDSEFFRYLNSAEGRK